MSDAVLIAYCLLSTGLTLLLGMGALALGRRRAALRHHLLTLGLGMIVVLPGLVAIVPASLEWEVPADIPAARILPPAPSTALANPDVSAAPTTEPGVSLPAIGVDSQASAIPSEPDRLPVSSRGTILALLLSAAGLGMLLVTVRHLNGTVAVRRLARRASALPALEHHGTRLARRVGLRRAPPILLSTEITVPITWGVLRPGIALPPDADRWPIERRDIVILHELAHVRRRDALALAISKWATALYWWNPIVWWLSRLIREDAELASDSLVLDCGVGPARYARELLAVLRWARTGSLPGAAVALGRGLPLADRIARALADRRAPGLLRPRTALVALVVALLLGTGLAAARPSSPSTQHPAENQSVESQPDAAFSRGPGEATADGRRLLLDAIRDRLKDNDPMVRRSALNALRDLEGTAVVDDASIPPLLGDPDPEVRRAAEIVLGLREPKPNLELDFTPEPRRAPAPGELAAIERQLSDAGPKEREEAIRRLGGLRHPDLVRLLVLGLSDDSKLVRQVAAGELGDLRDPEAAPHLERALRDPSEHVRQTAAGSLGSLGARAQAALPTLLAAAGDRDEHVRQAAVDAIGEIGSRRGEPALFDALADPNPFVRQAALNSLVEIQGTRERPR